MFKIKNATPIKNMYHNPFVTICLKLYLDQSIGELITTDEGDGVSGLRNNAGSTSLI
jgi:hypothetical protein